MRSQLVAVLAVVLVVGTPGTALARDAAPAASVAPRGPRQSTGIVGPGTGGRSVAPGSASRLSRRIRLVGSGPMWSCAVFDDHGVRCWGESTFAGNDTVTAGPHQAPLAVSGLGPAASVSVGYGASCAIRLTGTIRCWGLESSVMASTTSHAADIAGVTGAIDLAVGAGHACAIDAETRVWCWGGNGLGETGQPASTSVQAPMVVPGVGPARRLSTDGSRTCAVLVDESVRCWGYDATTSTSSGPTPLDGVGRVDELAGTDAQGCSLDVEGVVRCWGPAASLIAGPTAATGGTIPPTVIPVTGAVAIDLGCAVTWGEQLVCWGNARRPMARPVWPPAPIAGLQAVAVGGDCAVRPDHRLMCWGTDNFFGELGTFTASRSITQPVSIDAFTAADPVVKLVGGAGEGCAVLASGSASCWGTSSSLGDGGGSPSKLPTALAVSGTVNDVSLNSNGGCALLGQDVRCWDLLAGTSGAVPSPVAIGSSSPVVAIASDSASNCALLAAGTVRCWGGLSLPPAPTGDWPGVSDATKLFGGSGVTYRTLNSSGSVSQFGYPSATVTTTTPAKPIRKIVTALQLRCTVFTDGTATCDDGTTIRDLGVSDAVDLALNHGSFNRPCVVHASGAVSCASPSWILLDVPGITDATQVAAIGQTYCAVTGVGVLRCWGDGTTMPQRGYGMIDVPWLGHDLTA